MAERRYSLSSPSRPLAIPALGEGAVAGWLRETWQRLRHPDLSRNDLWRLLWLPFWLGGDMPPLSMPVRLQPLPSRRGQAGDQVVATLDSVRRRFWLRHVLTLILRALWLTIGVGVIWLIIDFAGGPSFNGRGMLWIGGVLLAMALALGCFVRPTRQQTARMLDRSFNLHERMSTALDNLGKSIPADGERATMVYRQMADAANAAADVEHRPALRARLPIRELVMAMAATLLFLALFFLRGGGGDIPPLSQAAVPAFTPAAQRLAAQPTQPPTQSTKTPTSQEVQEQAARSNAARQGLQTLANALNDHAVTRPAAESITQGDYQTAADQLRSLGNQADKLSPQERGSLANDLNQAANSMQSTNPDLANAARQAASGLQQGGQSAQKGVRDLGDAVEQTGSNVVSQPQLASEMQQAQAAQTQQQAGSQSQQASQGQQSQGQQGAAQGQSSQQSSSQSAQGQAGQQQAGQSQQGQTGQADNAANSGAQGQQANGQQSGSQASGQQAQSGQQGQPANGQAQGQGNAQNPGQTAGQQAGSADSAQQSNQSGNQSNGAAQQGNGAGSGQSTGQSSTTSSNQSSANQQNSGNQGQPPQQKVVQGNGGGPGTQSTSSQDQSSQTVQLPTDNSGGNQTGNDPSSSSYGSGNGAVEAQGSVTQGNVGPNGPDSNSVPSQYRDIVKGYFDQQ